MSRFDVKPADLGSANQPLETDRTHTNTSGKSSSSCSRTASDQKGKEKDRNNLDANQKNSPVQNGGKSNNERVRTGSSIPQTRTQSEDKGILSTDSTQIEEGLNLNLIFPREALIHNYRKPEVTTGGKKRRKKLGVMIGVYLPSIQNVFGVVMFLRLCWMVGLMGVPQSFIMVFLCCLCTFLTCLSVSAIATNGVVESGGTYFMIARSLGPHLGVAIGILFYLANAIAVAMYIVGGIEIILKYMAPGRAMIPGMDDPESPSDWSNNVRIYGSIFLLILFIIISLGVRVVQYFAPISLFGVIVSIFAIYAGAIQKSLQDGDSRVKMCIMQNGSVVRTQYLKKHSNFTTLYSCDPCYQIGGYCRDGITGFHWKTLRANIESKYTKYNMSLYELDAKQEYYDGEQRNMSEVYPKDVALPPGERRYIYNLDWTSFFALMGVYFPSVTGILTGSNMSGDLKDPQYSIPLGTVSAQLTTTAVYLSFVVMFGSTIHPGILVDKSGDSVDGRMLLGELAWPSFWVVVVGCFLSTFGAGLQSLCSAPRLLASIGKDAVIPWMRVLGKTNCWDEPFIALLVTALIGFVCLMIGELDEVAQLVSMFFLQLYAFVNLTCAWMSLMGSPGWRPRFKFYHWSSSLFGFFLSYFIIFSTNWVYALLTCIILLFFVVLVVFKGEEKEWGDGLQGALLSMAQSALLYLSRRKTHVKNWRPQLLIIHQRKDSMKTLGTILTLVRSLKTGSGFVNVTGLLSGDATSVDCIAEREKFREDIYKEMETARVKGFVQVVLFSTGRLGAHLSSIIQSVGLSALKPNTLLATWPQRDEETTDEDYWAMLERLHRGTLHEMCLMIMKDWTGDGDMDTVHKDGPIDVWWIIKDGGILLLLAFLMQTFYSSKTEKKMRLFILTDQKEDIAVLREETEENLYKLRIRAEVIIVHMDKQNLEPYQRNRSSIDTVGTKSNHSLESMRSLIQKQKEIENQTESKEKLMSGKGKSMSKDEVGERNNNNVKEEGTMSSNDNTQTDEEKDAKGIKTGKDKRWDPYKASHHRTQFTFSPGNMENFEASYLEQSGKEAKAVIAVEETQDETQMHTAATRAPSYRTAHDHLRLITAFNLNAEMRRRSLNAHTLIINLPLPPRSKSGMGNYVDYMETLTGGLKRILLVRGTGKDMITIYQ